MHLSSRPGHWRRHRAWVRNGRLVYLSCRLWHGPKLSRNRVRPGIVPQFVRWTQSLAPDGMTTIPHGNLPAHFPNRPDRPARASRHRERDPGRHAKRGGSFGHAANANRSGSAARLPANESRDRVTREGARRGRGRGVVARSCLTQAVFFAPQ